MISFVVPFYNDSERVLFCISELVRQSEEVGLEVEVLPVNNASSQPLPDWENLSKVRCLNCEKPGSYSARNKGVKESRGSYIVFTDSDCFPSKDYVKNISKMVLSGVLEGKVVAGKVKIKSSGCARSTIYEEYDKITGLPQQRYVRKGVAVTANLIVPKEVFLKVGMFDEDAFSGGDADFCQRAIRHGYQLVYKDSIEVFHPARRELNEFSKKINRIVGAQLSRKKFSGKLLLFFSIVAFPVVEATRIFFSKKPIVNKLKAICALAVLSVIRVSFYFYHLMPGATKQR